jgi:hypothetical protein
MAPPEFFREIVRGRNAQRREFRGIGLIRDREGEANGARDHFLK